MDKEQALMNNLGARSVLLGGILLFWALLACLYLQNTPVAERSHDFSAHVEYTEIIANENRLPAPHEKFGTYHPPLYYLINSLVIPNSIQSENKTAHIKTVELLSILYGAVSLLIIAWFVQKLAANPIRQALVLVFIASTPKFVFIFSTYNNDSLATMLSLAMLAFSYALYERWLWSMALGLLLIATLAIHTKLTAFAVLGIIILICCKNILRAKLPNVTQLRIIAALALAALFLTPWLVFHNYRYTGSLFTSNFHFLTHYCPSKIVKK